MKEEKLGLPKTKKPEFLRFMIPVIQTLKNLGGSGLAGEVQEEIIEKYHIPQAELDAVNKNGGSKIKNQIAWVRFYLTKANIIDSSKRGVWALTDIGMETILGADQVYTLFKKVHSVWGGKKKDKDAEAKALNAEDVIEEEPDEFYAENNNYRIKLVDLLQNQLSSGGFERLCKRILRESGFTKVEVTGKTSDGGIDGIGRLEINSLMSFKVLFQCKKWKNTIPPSEIRDFRGAMAGRADKGIFLTTGTFSREAKKEAVRDGAAPIELVDIEKLIHMFELLELGLTRKTTYEVDLGFFEDFTKDIDDKERRRI